ncbi:Vesicle tethering protein Uso1/P115-like head domain-containing protein [Plasmodiophora brassicae]|uniref:Uncharacterized protein n=1 Tax=Plasmodiophora brassicae TaxID=37360 RepID=A0A3P3Y3I3_PLABS|nr:unnamed protein product [Plasmodiophora brassicae]
MATATDDVESDLEASRRALLDAASLRSARAIDCARRLCTHGGRLLAGDTDLVDCVARQIPALDDDRDTQRTFIDLIRAAIRAGHRPVRPADVLVNYLIGTIGSADGTSDPHHLHLLADLARIVDCRTAIGNRQSRVYVVLSATIGAHDSAVGLSALIALVALLLRDPVNEAKIFSEVHVGQFLQIAFNRLLILDTGDERTRVVALLIDLTSSVVVQSHLPALRSLLLSSLTAVIALPGRMSCWGLVSHFQRMAAVPDLQMHIADQILGSSRSAQSVLELCANEPLLAVDMIDRSVQAIAVESLGMEICFMVIDQVAALLDVKPHACLRILSRLCQHSHPARSHVISKNISLSNPSDLERLELLNLYRVIGACKEFDDCGDPISLLVRCLQSAESQETVAAALQHISGAMVSRDLLAVSLLRANESVIEERDSCLKSHSGLKSQVQQLTDEIERRGQERKAAEQDMQRTIDKARQAYNELEARMSQALHHHRSENDALLDKLRQLEQHRHELKDIDKVKNDLRSSNEQRERLAEELDRVRCSNADYKLRCEQLRIQLETSIRDLGDARRQLHEGHEHAAALSRQIKDQSGSFRSAMAEQSRRLADTENMISQERATREQLYKKLVKCIDAYANLEQDLDKANIALSTKERDSVRLGDMAAQLERTLQSNDEEIAKQKDMIVFLESRLETLERERDQLSVRLLASEGRASDLEQQNGKLQEEARMHAELTALIHRLSDTHVSNEARNKSVDASLRTTHTTG